MSRSLAGVDSVRTAAAALHVWGKPRIDINIRYHPFSFTTLACSVHTFDPDATPEEKRAQALKGAADKLAPLSDRLREKRHGGTGTL